MGNFVALAQGPPMAHDRGAMSSRATVILDLAAKTVLAALLLHEIPSPWISASWAALGLLLLAVWRLTGNRHWRLQAR